MCCQFEQQSTLHLARLCVYEAAVLRVAVQQHQPISGTCSSIQIVNQLEQYNIICMGCNVKRISRKQTSIVYLKFNISLIRVQFGFLRRHPCRHANRPEIRSKALKMNIDSPLKLFNQNPIRSEPSDNQTNWIWISVDLFRL